MKKDVFSGLKILDHTSYLLGEYATQVFADLGAEVIKVENIKHGDYGRTLDPKINGVSYYTCALDRNKKSVSLNLKSEKGKEAYLRLLKEADVVFENFRPGVMKRLGIDYDFEKTVKPDIIHVAISAFGQEDPRSLLAYHDLNFQALSGYMYLNGPRHAPIHLCDMVSAMVAVQDIMAALLQRGFTGEGAFCDVSMFDCFIWWNAKIDEKWCFQGGKFEYSDLTFRFLGNWIWETKDGRHVALCLNEDKFWNTWIDMTGFEEMRPYMKARLEEHPEFFKKMEDFMKSKTLEEWNASPTTSPPCPGFRWIRPPPLPFWARTMWRSWSRRATPERKSKPWPPTAAAARWYDTPAHPPSSQTYHLRGEYHGSIAAVRDRPYRGHRGPYVPGI